LSFLPHVAGHFSIAAFCEISLAQGNVSGEDKKRQCGLRVQVVRNSRILTAASQYPSKCRCILNRRRKREIKRRLRAFAFYGSG
jgi:hypothetical protein